MKSRRTGKIARSRPPGQEVRDGIVVRACHGIAEFEACIRVELSVWQSADIDVVPIPLFVVAAETGGQVLGAFKNEDEELLGFTLAITGWRQRKPFLHSHMTAVLDGYRDRGIGRRLKLFQREDALARGIDLIEWTFDPLITKNAYFNFMRLGAIAHRYFPNAYGVTTSPLHSALPTDRLVAEWHLRSARVCRMLSGKPAITPFSKKAVRITIPADIEQVKKDDPTEAMRMQSTARAQFVKWFGIGYAATAVAPGEAGIDYVLEPWSET